MKYVLTYSLSEVAQFILKFCIINKCSEEFNLYLYQNRFIVINFKTLVSISVVSNAYTFFWRFIALI
jgi:hypothetical protein